MAVKKTGTVEMRRGLWYVRPTLADGTRGPRVSLPRGTTEARARATAEAMTERAIREGQTKETLAAKCAPAPLPPSGPTIAAWFERWLDERERRGLTSVRTDRGRWSKWIEPRLGSFDMATVSTEEFERFVSYLDEQILAGSLSWKTATNVWGLVSKACDDSAHSKNLELRVRKDNPAANVRPPEKGAKRSKQVLYPSEFLALMNCDRVPQRWARLIALNIYTYARAGELEALHVEDVDLAHRNIHIHRAIDRDSGEIKETKTNNPRRVPIEPNLMPLMEQLVADARAEGRELLVEMPPISDLAERLRKYLQWAGVDRPELYRTTKTTKQITWHDLRAVGATWLAIRREPPQMIMALCGHENMETTMGYVRLAAVLSVPAESVFPALPEAIVLPPVLPTGAKEWGSIGGKLSRSSASFGVPSGIRTPSSDTERPQFDRNSSQIAGSDAASSGLASPWKYTEGADGGQMAVAPCPVQPRVPAAASERAGRHLEAALAFARGDLSHDDHEAATVAHLAAAGSLLGLFTPTPDALALIGDAAVELLGGGS